MKRCLTAIACISILFSCQKKDLNTADPSVHARANNSEVPQAVKLVLIKAGFDTAKLSALREGYLVDDIYLTKAQITEFERTMNLPGNNQRHAHTNNLVTGNNTNITIRFNSSSYSNRWFIALRTAIAEWNEVANCRVNLIYTDAATADITVYEELMDEYSYGYAGWPGSGQPGNEVHFNTRTQLRQTYPNGPLVNLTTAMDVWTAIHEIGHTLGLRHTDWENNESAGGVGANYFPGIPNYDANSVMNSGASTWLWEYSNLTSADVTAIQALYPVITGTTFENYILGPQFIFANSQRTHTAGTFYFGAHYQWQLRDPWGTVIANFDETGPVLEWSTTLWQDDDWYLSCTITNLEAPGVTFTKHLITY